MKRAIATLIALLLQPANAQMAPIVVPGNDVRIQGRVVGVLRKYA